MPGRGGGHPLLRLPGWRASMRTPSTLALTMDNVVLPSAGSLCFARVCLYTLCHVAVTSPTAKSFCTISIHTERQKALGKHESRETTRCSAWQRNSASVLHLAWGYPVHCPARNAAMQHIWRIPPWRQRGSLSFQSTPTSDAYRR